jgi:hypothetical protein
MSFAPVPGPQVSWLRRALHAASLLRSRSPLPSVSLPIAFLSPFALRVPPSTKWGVESRGASCSSWSPRPMLLTKRKVARRSLSTNRAKVQLKSLCISVPYQGRKGNPRPPARPAPARGLRLPGKRPPPLPRNALVCSIRTRRRHPGIASIPHTPHSENPKAPARTAARALPNRPGHPSPAARIFYPTSLVPSVAICFLLRLVCSLFLVHAVSKLPGSPIVPLVATPEGNCTIGMLIREGEPIKPP